MPVELDTLLSKIVCARLAHCPVHSGRSVSTCSNLFPRGDFSLFHIFPSSRTFVSVHPILSPEPQLLLVTTPCLPSVPAPSLPHQACQPSRPPCDLSLSLHRHSAQAPLAPPHCSAGVLHPLHHSAPPVTSTTLRARFRLHNLAWGAFPSSLISPALHTASHCLASSAATRTTTGHLLRAKALPPA